MFNYRDAGYKMQDAGYKFWTLHPGSFFMVGNDQDDIVRRNEVKFFARDFLNRHRIVTKAFYLARHIPVFQNVLLVTPNHAVILILHLTKPEDAGLSQEKAQRKRKDYGNRHKENVRRL